MNDLRGFFKSKRGLLFALGCNDLGSGLPGSFSFGRHSTLELDGKPDVFAVRGKGFEYALDVITKIIIEVSSTIFVESTTLIHFRIFYNGDKEKWAPNGIAQSRGERK